VQSVINLDELAKNDKPKFGELKMTVAQFFRINGGTTQLHGVTPDISLPMISDTEDFGESSFDNALPWSQIKPADYKPVGDLTGVLPTLINDHDMRVRKDKEFKYLQEEISEFNAQRKKNLISLNESERRKEKEIQEARLKSKENDRVTGKASGSAKSSAFQDDGLLSSERNLAADLAIEKANKEAKDILLNEAAHILSDEIGLLKINPQASINHLPRFGL
jgi:carboxyl-terminal processing protease